MKKSSLILLSIALMWPAASISQASQLAPTSFPQETSRDMRPQAQNTIKGKDDPEFKFEGLENVLESDLRKVLRERRVNVTSEDIKDQVKLHMAESAIKEYLAMRGYMSATVTIRQGSVPRIGKSITFVVNEGERARISEIQFQGNEVFASDQLVDAIEKADKSYDGRCLPSEAGYDSDVFELCLRSVTLWMRSKGYLQAKLGKPKYVQSGRELKITIPVEEGVRYRLGDIRIENSKLLTPAQIVEMIGLRNGDIADRDIIAKGLEDIWRLYADSGYLDCTSDIDTVYRLGPGGGSEGTVDFVISLDEGRRFTVRRIEFKGDASAGEAVRTALLLRQGDVYSERLFQESLKNINRSGIFGEIFWRIVAGTGRSSGVELLTDENTSDLRIVFNLRRVHSEVPDSHQ